MSDEWFWYQSNHSGIEMKLALIYIILGTWYQSNHSGIEIRWEDGRTGNKSLYQSNHSGIEMDKLENLRDFCTIVSIEP